MKSILRLVAINSAFKDIGRYQERAMVSSLNWSISALLASDIRKSLTGVAIEEKKPEVNLDPLIEKYGNTLDKRNEEDNDKAFDEQERKAQLDMGLTPGMPALELAGRLKVVRDYLAEDLSDNATWMTNPLDPRGGKFQNPYEIAEDLEESFLKQVGRSPRVNETMLRAQAAHAGISYELAYRVSMKQNEASQKFLRDHKDEVLSKLSNIHLRADNGQVIGTDEAEEIEQTLPGIQRARLFVNAEKGLMWYIERQVGMLLRRHPEAKGNLKLAQGAREELHFHFNALMKLENVYREIDEAVQRGATWPTMQDIEDIVDTKKTA